MAKQATAKLDLPRPLPLRQPTSDLLPYTTLDPLLSGLPRGAITEIVGAASSGRTAVMQSMLATATRGGEVCAVVDTHVAFDPQSARLAEADLGKLLWVQCAHQVDKAMRAADMILHAGGFGLVVLDLADAPVTATQRIPTSHWYRFQRAVEHTPTVLIVLGTQSLARACAARQIELTPQSPVWQGRTPFALLEGMELEAGLRKPVLTQKLTLAARLPATLGA
ncbi:MAG: hypothetical protein NTV70_18410 [Acidobacteria bacterium]|nr:hypothetical protein [Acidobacteriota bacterium]